MTKALVTSTRRLEGAAGESVELVRARRSSDLWSAIEAAQSGRVVLRDEPADAAEEEAMARLADTLDRAVEAWEQEGLQNKAPLLGLIDAGLAALAPSGLSLYWGCVERRIALETGADVPMQVAVLAIGRSSAPTLRIEMPLLLDAADAGEQGEEG
ncbi:MAG: hypothetical protein ACXW3P_01470 [Rhodospirillales bacterium]